MHPPAADPCLSKPYSSRPKQKGGTIIARAVVSLAMHLKLLESPHKCCPEACRCGCKGLHVHGTRERRPRRLIVDGQPVPVVPILVFLCAACGATWRILPAFLARCLWHPWQVVEREVLGQPRGSADPMVPERTVQRWCDRLRQAAYLAVQVLAAAGHPLREVAIRLGHAATRLDLLLALGGRPAVASELLHRSAPGVRLM